MNNFELSRDIDSYLGYFGKEVIEGTAADASGLQDIILLVVLGVSVLIGVFASQLAGETWESVNDEIEAEKLKKAEEATNSEDEVDDGLVRYVFGIDLPEWVVGAQIGIKEAEVRVESMIQNEYKARVWNCTDDNPPSFTMDPSKLRDSPEVSEAYRGFDVVAAICDGFVLSPLLIKTYFKYGDPLYDEAKDIDLQLSTTILPKSYDTNVITVEDNIPSEAVNTEPLFVSQDVNPQIFEESLLKSLNILRENVVVKLQRIEKDLNSLSK